MDKILKNANDWFKKHNIDTFIVKNKMYINLGICELELSEEEIKYRANLINKDLKKQAQ